MSNDDTVNKNEIEKGRSTGKEQNNDNTVNKNETEKRKLKKGSSTGKEMSNNNTVNKKAIQKQKFVDNKERSIRKKRPKQDTDSSRARTRTMRGKEKSISSDEEYTSSSQDINLSDNEEPEEEATMDLLESDKRGGRGDEGSCTFSRRRFLDALNREGDDVSDEATASTTSNRHTALRNEASLPLPCKGNTNVASSLIGKSILQTG